MKITIIGAGAIGGTIGARMFREGHDVTLCDADPEYVAAIRETDSGSRVRSRSSRCGCPPSPPTSCPTDRPGHRRGQEPPLGVGGRAPAPPPVARRLRADRAERPDRRRHDRGRGPRAGDLELRQLRRRRDGPGPRDAGQRGHLPSRRDRRRRHHRPRPRARRRSALRRADRQRARLPVGQGGLRRDDVGRRRLRPLDRRDPRGPALPARHDRDRPRGARAGAGDGRELRRLRPRRPRRVSRPARRVQPAERQDPRGIYRDLMVRKRKTEVDEVPETSRARSSTGWSR